MLDIAEITTAAEEIDQIASSDMSTENKVLARREKDQTIPTVEIAKIGCLYIKLEQKLTGYMDLCRILAQKCSYRSQKSIFNCIIVQFLYTY